MENLNSYSIDNDNNRCGTIRNRSSKGRAQSPTMDIYVEQACSTSSLGTTAVQMQMHLAEHCEPTNFGEHILYMEMNETAVCQRTWNSLEECQDAVRNRTTTTMNDIECGAEATLFDTCHGDQQARTSRFVEWCIESDVPVGLYTTPLQAIYTYDSSQDCFVALQSHHGRVRTHFAWVPDDAQLCQPVIRQFNDTASVPGSLRTFCENETLVTRQYTSLDCSDFDDNPIPSLLENSKQCNERPWADTWVRSTCGTTPAYHCMAFYGTIAGSYFYGSTTGILSPAPTLDGDSIVTMAPNTSRASIGTTYSGFSIYLLFALSIWLAKMKWYSTQLQV